MPRIRIKKAPVNTTNIHTGDQAGFGLYVAGPLDLPGASSSGNVRSVVSPVAREEANIEAERGETITGDYNQDGMAEHFRVGGKRHSQGGTPLQVPDGSFVFSDNHKLRLGGPVLQHFGKSATTLKKFTPAKLARQYDLNSYNETLKDPDADRFDQDTAALMISNNAQKLSKLALLQEALKGFPEGIPDMALPALQTGQTPQLRYGGTPRTATGIELPVDPHKGDKHHPRSYQQRQLQLQKGFNRYSTPWLGDFGYPDSPAGLDQALTDAGYSGDLDNARQVQQFLVRENLRRGNRQVFDRLMGSYGNTNQGIAKGLGERTTLPDYSPQTLDKIFSDNMFGVRSGLLLQSLLDRPLRPSPVAPVKPAAPATPDVTGLVPYIPISESPAPPVRFTRSPQEPMPWWGQDMINMGSAIANRYDLRKYMPTYVGTDVVLPDATFYDPTRALAANQEQAAQQHMTAAMYAGPQRLRAVGSSIQGQGAKNAADILSQVQNQNVGVANQFEGVTSEILNNKSLRDAAARKQYYDELATVNQQYDNSVREGEDVMRSNLINGMTNAQKTYWLNRMNEQYRIDPVTGRISFTKGKDLTTVPADAGDAGMLDRYKAYYDQFLSKLNDPAKAHDFAQKMTFGNTSRFRANSDGDTQMSASSYGMNPMAMQLLGMYAPQFLQQ